MTQFPHFFRIRQRFEAMQVPEVASETRREMELLLRNCTFIPGKTVAVTAGSRGVTQIDTILKTVVSVLREANLEPFLVPAMGSHGGATSEGQTQLLARYGITPERIACPIRSSMETVVLDTIKLGEEKIPIHFDRYAAQADYVFLVNRVKPHTRFAGSIESGLLKMMMIGLGKAAGASVYHRAIGVRDFDRVVRGVTAKIRAKIPFLGGLAIVENAFDTTALLRACIPLDFEKTDEELLGLAKYLLPKLPFEEIDLLFIDQIGKNISGTGLDSNIVGRKFDDHKAVPGEKPVVHCIAVRDLTPETHGNANGIGMVEFCKKTVLEKMNVSETRINAMTANHVSAAMTPLDYETDEEILEAARCTLGHIPVEQMRIVRIRDTLHLRTILCSQSLWHHAKQLESLGAVEVLEEPFPGGFHVGLSDRVE